MKPSNSKNSEGLPASPCVRRCCLDEAEICLGCGRSLTEILAWHAADARQREQILAAAQARRASHDPF